jgi:competence protein ComEC
MNKQISAILGVKLPFFMFTGSITSYYGFAPAYGAGNVARPLLPAVLIILAAVSFLSVIDAIPARSPQTRFKFKKARMAAVFFLAGFTVGIACRGAATRNSAVSAGLENENITALSGSLLDDPRNTASGRGMATLSLSASRGKGGARSSARGKILVFFSEGSIPRLKEFGRGSEIYVEGSFAKTESQSFYSKTPLFRAKSVHITRPASRFEQWRTGIRLALIEAFAPPESGGAKQRKDWGGLALALLLGIKDNLDGELAEQYRNAGCSYILALSGMHLAIVSSIIAFLLRKPLGKKMAALVGIIFILLYVFLVGSFPSLTRAAIMYVIGSIAIIFTLPVTPSLLLGFSFIIQIIAEPEAGDSVSFILSYLALAGLLTLGQWIARLFRGHLPECAASPLSASLGAFTGTMAVSVLFFGSLRPVSIAAGLVMGPLTTVFMIGAIIYLVLNFVFPPLAFFAGRFLSFVYTLLEKTTYTAGLFPEILFPNVIFSVIISIIIPVVILIACKIIYEKRIYLEKFA